MLDFTIWLIEVSGMTLQQWSDWYEMAADFKKLYL
jgi:hypothetical protein